MGKQEYLSAGRFAALVGTTKETLFHYDEIGLVVPKRRGTNGYRYYAMDQMETFDDRNAAGAGHAAGRDSKLSGTAKS